MPSHNNRLQIVGATRHLIHSALHDEVAARNGDRLALRGSCRVAALLWSEDKSAVEGGWAHEGPFLLPRWRQAGQEVVRIEIARVAAAAGCCPEVAHLKGSQTLHPRAQSEGSNCPARIPCCLRRSLCSAPPSAGVKLSDGEELRADVVVMASGRQSRLPQVWAWQGGVALVLGGTHHTAAGALPRMRLG